MGLARVRSTWQGRNRRRGWLAAAGVMLLVAHLGLALHLSAHLYGPQEGTACPVCTAGHHAGDLLPASSAPTTAAPDGETWGPIASSRPPEVRRGNPRARGPPAAS